LNCIYTVYTDQMRDTAGDFRVDFSNQNYPDRLGWREIVVTGQSVSLEGDFMSKSISNRLVSYPNDLLANPPDQRQVSFEARPGESKIRLAPASERMAGGVITVDRNDGFTRLILQNETTIPALLLALGIAFAWGAMHAMTPGHGKTIVGAYLVGSRGTALHALYLGLTTTITHTAGVFVLGAVTMFASRVLFPERLFPWLSLVSGLLVVGIGVSLFWNRQKAARKRAGQPVIQEPGFSSNGAHDHSPSQKHPNERDHDHDHNHDHDHDHDHTHSHTHDSKSYHHHDHAHEEYLRHHDLEFHGHQHGPGGHTHLPPGADGSPVTWRSLLMLGISGGLLPCPSALVVMLSAIALGRIGFGLLLVVAFSLGLATVLAGIGLVFVYAGKIFERFPVQARLLRWFPAVSAIFIALVGAGIAARALVEIGVL
jgi:ABC-type nickel/cobalt efflux system permease component RcnA